MTLQEEVRQEKEKEWFDKAYESNISVCRNRIRSGSTADFVLYATHDNRRMVQMLAARGVNAWIKTDDHGRESVWARV